ncbi:MAG: metal-dependent transcriptional regulator [Lewinellaceae bacterium]|nr:metal-dependent transcriptional regulator [Lewinellaceae bacterium]MCB9290199.1 metal-dependent transcriptional regulator [Lewinellaceae bacterium]
MNSTHPGASLLIGVAILAVLLWALWPKRGLLALLNRARMNTRRALLEDALKFLFDCEYKGVSCGLNSIAGNLNISADKAAHLLNRLRAMGLIRMEEQEFFLTDTGRPYALRIVRVHRIWERYLADETGMGPMEWHGEADLQEHNMSAEAADELAARMGNPVFDPHGDPIPSARGELPAHRGRALSTLREGDIAQILHIEDEPHTIYEQLTALGLYPGMQVYVMDITEGKVSFAANGEECVLTPLFASSVTVELLPERAPLPQKYELLSSLKLGEKAEVVGISPNCRGQQRRRLMDLGVVPGTIISAELRSASNDPVAYRIMGATIAIRKDQASLIFINKKEALPNEQTSGL